MNILYKEAHQNDQEPFDQIYTNGMTYCPPTYQYPMGQMFTGMQYANPEPMPLPSKYHGKTAWPTGCTQYDGEFENGFPSGKGTAFQPDGRKLYEGNWKNGKYHGKGVLFHSNGKLKSYEGDWIDGKKQGQGIKYHDSGKNKQYQGAWFDDKEHGKGTSYHTDGSKHYEGKWLEGKQSGKGIVYWVGKDVKHFEGSFIKGKLNGNGVEYSATGEEVYRGNFVGGKRAPIQPEEEKKTHTNVMPQAPKQSHTNTMSQIYNPSNLNSIPQTYNPSYDDTMPQRYPSQIDMMFQQMSTIAQEVDSLKIVMSQLKEENQKLTTANQELILENQTLGNVMEDNARLQNELRDLKNKLGESDRDVEQREARFVIDRENKKRNCDMFLKLEFFIMDITHALGSKSLDFHEQCHFLLKTQPHLDSSVRYLDQIHTELKGSGHVSQVEIKKYMQKIQPLVPNISVPSFP